MAFLNFKKPFLYCITDKKLSPNNNVLVDIEQMCQGGGKIIQLREKNISLNDYIILAKKALQITKKYKAKLIINDSIEAAKVSRADGAHLGQTDGQIEKARARLGKKSIIGLSVSDFNEFQKAQAKNPDYIGAGAVFPTNTKPKVNILGLKGLKKICAQKNKTPIVAIGGIGEENISKVLGAGADGAAMIGAILKSKNIKKEVKKYLEILAKLK